jgi:hypothetical protein
VAVPSLQIDYFAEITAMQLGVILSPPKADRRIQAIIGAKHRYFDQLNMTPED